MTTEKIFEDPVIQRLGEQSNDSTTSNQLIVRISHEDKGPLTSNFTRVQQLLNIESMAKNNQESDFSLDHENVFLKRLESPISSWNNAFLTRNKSIVNSSSWGDFLHQSMNKDGVEKMQLQQKSMLYKPHY